MLRFISASQTESNKDLESILFFNRELLQTNHLKQTTVYVLLALNKNRTVSFFWRNKDPFLLVNESHSLRRTTVLLDSWNYGGFIYYQHFYKCYQMLQMSVGVPP